MRGVAGRLATLVFCGTVLGPGVADLGAQTPGEAGIEATDGMGQFWYVGRQLRRPLVVELAGETAASCSARRVTFDAGDDGGVSPEVAGGRWVDGRCVAEGWWNLGPTVGMQHVEARVDGGGQAVFQAVARQGARIFFGGAWTPREERWVELVEPDEGSPYLRDNEPTGVFRPIVGVDFALWPSWRRIRMGVAASAREIDRHFYVGLSALQALVLGPGQEGSAVDVHVGLQLSRRDIGVSGAACAPVTVCTRRDLRLSGLTFMVTVDGASAFRGLAGAVLR